MHKKKAVSFACASQVVKPKWRNLVQGDGVAEIESAEFRVRNAVAGNDPAIDLVFDTLARQSQQGNNILGPFIFAGASGTGKSTFINALVSTSSPEFLIEFDLGSCRAAHDGSSVFGSPPGYQDCDKASPFAQSLNALNKALYSYSGPKKEMPLPVLCFDNADEAHPEVLASLKRFLTSGILKKHAGTEVKVRRCAIILTANRVGAAFNLLRSQDRASIGPDVKRLIGNLKASNGMPVFKRDILEMSTIVPFFEPGPSAISALLSASFGREVALACGIPDKQTGRVRLASREMERLWNCAKIEPTASARHIIAAMADEWNDQRALVLSLARMTKDVFREAPPERHAYFVAVNRTSQKFECPISSLENVGSHIVANLPIPYVERIYGESAVSRGDYWTIADDFENRLTQIIAGQASLIKAVGDRMRARLPEKGEKPMISFMVTGTTGTGKTELGKAIAAISGQPLVFCDCNTWQNEEAVFDGIFGDSETSVATKLRENPASVIVFDEVDKAHKKFWDFYMTVGDTGQIVDKRTGSTISLRHAVIELTSNYMADRLDGLSAQAGEKTVAEMDPLIRKALCLCGSINSACLERLDLAALMLPLAGVDSYPVWNKFVAERLRNLNIKVMRIGGDVAAYLENRHMDKGGAPGARARQRTCEDLFANCVTGSENDFELVEGEFCLSPSGLKRHKVYPAPRSERQRLWCVTNDKIARLKSDFRGNDALVDSVVAMIKEEAMKVNPRGPVGVILAVGPTGSGKSYLGKALSQAFGKGDAVEVQCVQCGDAHSVAPFLFSAPAGYARAEVGGQLTIPVMTRKDRVFIFDEIDRAHPSLLDKILNVLDEGVATDMGTQLPADLKQSLFVLTSNLAAEELDAAMRSIGGATMDEKEAVARKIIEQTGQISAPMLARIHRVFAMTYQHSDDDGGAIQAAIRSVLGEYDCLAIRVDKDTVRILGNECREKSLRDVRAMRRLVQAKLAPALLGNKNAEFVLSAGVIWPKFPIKLSSEDQAREFIEGISI